MRLNPTVAPVRHARLSQEATMGVDFGILLMSTDPTRIGELSRTAEGSGFDRIRFIDSQSLYPELWSCVTVGALSTSRVKVGPGVTNPLTRHPSVTASALATVDALSNGRAFLGIGTGDSAVYSLGMHGARLQVLREYVLAVRGLLERGEASYQGQDLRMTWYRKRIPIYIAAHGPKTIRLAGEIADGVIIGTGFTPEAVQASLEQLREGARSAGRDPGDLDVWWWGLANLAPSRERAVEEIRMSLAAIGNILARFTVEGKQIPALLKEPFRRLNRQYAVGQHVVPGRTSNAQLVEEVGLTDYLAERFAFVGTPEECEEQVQRAVAAGAGRFFLSIHTPDEHKTRFMRDWSRVMARLG